MSRDDDIVIFEHERDKITVGDLREWHYLEVTCPACSRVGRIYPTALRKRYHESMRVADLARSFRCWARGTGRWRVWKIARSQ